MLDNVAVFSLWKDFTGWLLDHTQNFPKSVRFTFSSRIDNLTLDILQQIVKAAYKKNKKEILLDINLNLTVLRLLLSLSYDRKYLPPKSYKYAMEKIGEAGRMIGGWLRSCK